MEFYVIDICTNTIIVFLISVHLHEYALALLDKYPPQTNPNFANILAMHLPPTSPMPPPSSHIHTKT